MDYKSWKLSEGFGAGSEESVGARMESEGYEAQAPSTGDIAFAIEWLLSYDVDGLEDESYKSLVNVIAMLDGKITSKQKASVMAQAKRKYAQAHGLKVSQVRIKK